MDSDSRSLSYLLINESFFSKIYQCLLKNIFKNQLYEQNKPGIAGIIKMRKQTGFTLIEILVTVVVLAIGLLGLAGLQATSLKFNSTAYQRSQATNLAYDIADRMRANAIAARNGNYNVNDVRNNPPAGANLAAIDLGEWRQALINALPLGTGSIITNPATNITRITIQWDDDRDAATANQSFQMDTEL